MRRRDRALPEDEAQKILRECEYASFCTVGADGAPYSVPVSPVLLQGAVYFHCAKQGQKLDNIARDPRVSLCCVGKTRLLPEEFSTLFESAVVTGRASMVEDEAQKVEVLRAICQKYAASNMHNFEREVALSLHRTGICKIEIESVTGKAKRTPRE
ncbi:pyridoxamine 5'-phosphate oxidase family protein [Harryflintia acetispora]|uniref:pyridoxamine 5'-phosphate oxidase family protein n=1 Tax=Harryflintia acetispora TaxID=1849041 RepID=UPI001896BC01|nr:pyridoxamine 5'-phosphate oxidase family protein [Harryflintia acetispora]